MSKSFKKYYLAILSYGHVGIGNEVSVARYLEVNEDFSMMDVYDLANNMPGVKAQAVKLLKQITLLEYKAGRIQEKNNFYIKRLKGIN